MATGNRWGRAIGAGVLVEVLLFAVIILSALAFRKFGPRTANVPAFLHGFGSWVACVGGPIVTFLCARWALRPVSAAHMAHALVVAGVAAAIHVPLYLGMTAEWGWQWQFYLAIAVMIGAGAAAALLAKRGAPPGTPPASPTG
jgi:hypothetical protein